MYQKKYRSIASYEALKNIESLTNKAQSANDIKKIMREYCPKLGYKCIGYIIAGFGTPESMKGESAIN